MTPQPWTIKGAGAQQGSTRGNLIFPSLPHSIPHLQVGKPMLFFMEKNPWASNCFWINCFWTSSQRRWTNTGNPWLSKKAAATPPAWFPGSPNTHQTFPRKTCAHHLPGLPETASVLAPTTSSQHLQPPQTTKLLCPKKEGRTAEAGGNRNTWQTGRSRKAWEVRF